MTFYASYFVYDNINSYEYDLTISSLDSSGVEKYPGANVQIQTEKIYRNSKPYLFGVEETPVLTIPVTITVPWELDSTQSSFISRWLFGKKNYKVLKILQPDMMYVYFNAIFTDPEIIKIGNTIRGYSGNIVCDSPFAWEYTSIDDHVYGLDNYIIDEIITINNLSDSSEYYYPDIEFKINQFVGGIDLVNLSDNENRVFAMSNLSPNEVIRIGGYSKIVTSSVRTNSLSKIDGGYNWFRYIPGKNLVKITGNINYIRFINNFPKKII